MTIKYLFSRQKQLPIDRYDLIKSKIEDLELKQQVEIFELSNEERAKKLLVFLFTNILPQHGMVYRESQMKLSLSILETLQKKEIALCEAEVGTGKTHAYILATVVYNLFTKKKTTTIISTSTLALQKAITGEYIPQISDILLEHRIIKKPLTYVVRKGKSHYICDNYVNGYANSLPKTEENQLIINTLYDVLNKDNVVDLDDLELSDYVKIRLGVYKCNPACNLSNTCRYRNFLRNCQETYFDYQIANHNYIVASMQNHRNKSASLLSKHEQVIFDEAHKLHDVVKEMYYTSMEDTEIELLTSNALRLISNKNGIGRIKWVFTELVKLNELLFSSFKKKTVLQADMQIKPTTYEVKILNTMYTVPMKQDTYLQMLMTPVK